MTAQTSNVSPGVADLDGLFRRYSGELNHYAFRRLNDREAAADVVQDSFLRFLVWKRDRQNAVFPHGPRSFLWKVVGNLTIDLVRRNRVLGPMVSLDDALEAADPHPTPDRCFEARQQYLLLKKALDGLPARTREALLLNRAEGLSHAEVGAKLGVSSSMATKYIMTALAHCIDRMPDEGAN
jgi:RNA polymerase sigma-70 factor (ECF subfamily)